MNFDSLAPTHARIAFLGLGAMGGRMARRLLDAGADLTVWNRDPARTAPLVAAGATAAGTPAAAVPEADVVFAMVRDDVASRAVWLGADGALARLRTDAVAVDCSTLSPAWARELAEAGSDLGKQVLEAPVVGTRPHAESGALTVLAGGDADVLARVEPLLGTFAGAIHHTGGAGTGAAIKLAVNAIFAAQVAGLAEWLAALPAAGVPVGRAVEILNALPTASPAAKRAAELIEARHVAPNFPVELVRKDLGYAREVLRDAGVDASVVAGAERAFAMGVERGLGDLDIVGIARLHTNPDA